MASCRNGRHRFLRVASVHPSVFAAMICSARRRAHACDVRASFPVPALRKRLHRTLNGHFLAARWGAAFVEAIR